MITYSITIWVWYVNFPQATDLLTIPCVEPVPGIPPVDTYSVTEGAWLDAPESAIHMSLLFNITMFDVLGAAPSPYFWLRGSSGTSLHIIFSAIWTGGSNSGGPHALSRLFLFWTDCSWASRCLVWAPSRCTMTCMCMCLLCSKAHICSSSQPLSFWSLLSCLSLCMMHDADLHTSQSLECELHQHHVPSDLCMDLHLGLVWRGAANYWSLPIVLHIQWGHNSRLHWCCILCALYWCGCCIEGVPHLGTLLMFLPSFLGQCEDTSSSSCS